jgi:hypothetical protein
MYLIKCNRCASSYCPGETLSASIMSDYTAGCLNGGGGVTSASPISTPTAPGASITTTQAAAPTTTKGSVGGVTTSPVVGVSTAPKSSAAVSPTTFSQAGADAKFAVSAGGLVAGILGVLVLL